MNTKFGIIFCLLGIANFGFGSPTGMCDYGAVAQASRRFAFELYETVSKSDDVSDSGNIFLAPTTVTSGLTMIHAGADGNTKDQIWRGLQLDATYRRLSEDDMPCVIELSNPAQPNNEAGISTPKDEEVVFRTVTRLYGEKSYRFRRAFIMRTKELGEKMKRVSFSTEPRDSRNRINHWVSKMTNDKIPRLFKKADITSNTVMAVVSAVYFKAPWQTPFRDFRTAEFTTEDGRGVMAQYMRSLSQFKWTVSGDLNAELIELPYKYSDAVGSNISMIILKPTTTMENLEYSLTEQITHKAILELNQSPAQMCDVVIPKFEMSLTYDLKPLLGAIGMDDMFISGIADLSRMADPNHSPAGALYVSSAVHKTFIKVTEFGTEATGATGLGIANRMLPLPVRVNKAFITLIYDKTTETVLFIGKVNDPSATE